MSWYKIGTIAATNGSKIITGEGTQFTNSLNGVSAGRMLLLPAAGTVQIYEIESVQSDTQLTLMSAFTGTTGAGKAYAIPTSPTVSIEQFAHEFSSTLAYYQQQLSGWQQILTGTGNVTLTTPEGQTVTVRSQQAWDAVLNGKVTGVKQTSQDDTTAGSVVLNGGHGLGANARPRAAGATGGAAGCGFFSYTANHADNPFGGTGASGLHVQEAGTYGWDLLGRDGDGIDFRLRQISSGVASPWSTLWTSANLTKQGSVADTAAGAVMINGAHGGLGGNAIFVDNDVDIHSYLANKPSMVFSGNTPLINGAGFAAVYDFKRSSSNYAVLIAYPITGSGTVSIKYFENPNWSAWHKQATLDTPQSITGAKEFTSPITLTNGLNSSTIFSYPGSAFVTISSVSTSATSLGLAIGPMTRATNPQLVFFSSGLNNTHDVSLQATGGTSSAGNGTLNITAANLRWNSSAILAQGRNAVADPNGFWKTASPVVKLFANGTSELTSEAEGITTQRLSEGVYRISGCLGLNADRAWGGDDGGIDVPMCRNKLPRLWVDYGGDEGSEQINPDGSIIIRAYHRPHPDAPVFARNEIEGYANGDPIDIPRDTFISVRVQMPEREEPKPKVMHSNVYCNTAAN